MRRTVTILTAAVLLVGAHLAFSQSKETRAGSALGTLRHYIEIRLRWASWDEYSQYITWPEEPGWDCFWVSKEYKVGQQSNRGGRVIVPVTYSRLGQYCSGFDFVSQPKQVTIRYELVQIRGAWKINAPAQDTPYLDWRTLQKSLMQTANNERETAEARKQAETVSQTLSRAVAARPNSKIQ
jgi:hypothetical protein